MIDYRTITTDVLVIGGGIAGLKAALSACRGDTHVAVITKTNICASDHVLGFNAAVYKDDTEECFARDTLAGGRFINNASLVHTLAANAVKEVKAVEDSGLEFDMTDGGYDLLKPLGCTHPRLVHIKNKTGRISLDRFRELAAEKGIAFYSGLMMTDIITKDGRAVGAVALNTAEKTAYAVFAKAVVLTTGGVHIADKSTYPDCMTGDGYAAAYRAGAHLTDMEFIQFEPVRCIYPKPLGISTTLLAKGGVITNKYNERFLLRNFSSESKASKDELAKYIAMEIAGGRGTEHGGVYLDLTGIPGSEIRQKHSMYYERFMNAGIDLTKQKIEAAPCAHSFMGGVVCDSKCRTHIGGLFVAGEVMGGLHGANRVGGNAGTEIYVFGTIAGASALEYADSNPLECDTSYAERYIGAYKTNGDTTAVELRAVKTDILKIMEKYMGPVRDSSGIETASERLDEIAAKLGNMTPADFEVLCTLEEIRNLVTVCRLSVSGARQRKESRGVHFRLDHPDEDPEYQKSFECYLNNGI